jgi:PAS domain-containing protein
VVNQSSPLSSDSTDITIGIVGIVASLGGIEAVTQVLANLAANFPVPILVLQHLGRGQSSFVELLGQKSRLSVRWASDGEVLEPATVYVIPAKCVPKALPDGTLSLVPFDDLDMHEQARGGWPAPDIFLTSLAFSYGHHALALILSGLGTSGTIGVQEIQQQGGIVFAQDEPSASSGSMPRAAIDTGSVDLILPLHAIASSLNDVVCKGSSLPHSSQEIRASEELFSGGGVAGVLMHNIDWSRTALGRVLNWGETLGVMVRVPLASPQPLALLWGENLIHMYNDAFSTLLGDAHPQALGKPLDEGWEEGKHLLLPLIEQVRRTGWAIERANMCFPTLRHGFLQEEYATISVSPVRNEQGSISGFLLTAISTTDQHVSERRLHTLRELGLTPSPHQSYEVAARVLKEILSIFPSPCSIASM